MHLRKPATTRLLGAVVLASLALVGCSNNAPATTTGAAPVASVSADTAAAGGVPEKIKKAGVIKVGIDATYAPNEFKDPSGKATGWGVELLDAVAAKLGVKTTYQQASFDTIIPGLTGGKYDVGLSSFFDTKEREKIVDMVNYYTAGTQWASRAGDKVDPDNACGLSVAVQAQTTPDLKEIPARSAKCTAAGKPAITKLKFDSQDAATSAVATGRVAAFVADSPVTQYQVKNSKGKLQLAGDVYDVVLYGMPIAKENADLAKAMVSALASLSADGTYKAILDKYGVSTGAVSTFGVNGAKS
jgi:polar amino acid transport system substrate-binding protein